MSEQDKAGSRASDQPAVAAEFDRNALARSFGHSFGVEQHKGESDDAYRERLSGVLRQQGHIIEAHEVHAGRRFDDPEQGQTGPMLGIIGAVAQIKAGREYSPLDPQAQVGDDLAVGMIVQLGEDPARAAIGRILDTFGPTAGMDIIDGMRKPGQK